MWYEVSDALHGGPKTLQSHIRHRVLRAVCGLRAPFQIMPAVLVASLLAGTFPLRADAVGNDHDDATILSASCRAGQKTDSRGKECPPEKSRQQSVYEAKVAAAAVYDEFLRGEASRVEVEQADYTLARLTNETIGAHDWSTPETTPAALKLRGEAVPANYGPLQAQFWPFEQITWWYCGPATAQSVLWFLGPHRSESYDEIWQGRPSLTGNPFEDQWLLAGDFWLSTNRYEGTPWGWQYMPYTFNTWRGTFWYVQSETPFADGELTKEQALAAMRYDFDRSYPVAENVLYSPMTYYPYGFWPGITYQHWDVAYGLQEDETGIYVQIGQVYNDERFTYRRFQQVAWDVHWGAIANWFGIVW